MAKREVKRGVLMHQEVDFQKVAKENLILEIKSGSHMFGTNTPDSDQDFVGIFMPPPEILFGLQECELVTMNEESKDSEGRNTSEAVDRTFYNIKKFVKLALQNNPNIINVLFASPASVVFQTVEGAELLGYRCFFPHKGCYHRYVSYARSQKHKMLIKACNYEELQETLTELEKEHHVHTRRLMDAHEEGSEYLRVSEESVYHFKVGDLLLDRKLAISDAISKVKKRLDSAGNRTSLITKYGFDTKFGSNLIMLLRQGIELLRTGKLTLPLPYAQEIIDIKQGKFEAQEVIELAKSLEKEAEYAYETSTLSDKPRIEEVESFLIRLFFRDNLNHYKNCIKGGVSNVPLCTDCIKEKL
jgi:predicted nucleotidyltransferase